jgi:hypothetical protein
MLTFVCLRPRADVRSFAVKQLQRAENEDLVNFLCQLVQALRYEPSYPSFLSEYAQFLFAL